MQNRFKITNKGQKTGTRTRKMEQEKKVKMEYQAKLVIMEEYFLVK